MPTLKLRQDLLQKLDDEVQCVYDEVVFHPVLNLLPKCAMERLNKLFKSQINYSFWRINYSQVK